MTLSKLKVNIYFALFEYSYCKVVNAFFAYFNLYCSQRVN